MRREDTDNAFQLVLEAYSSGILFEDYFKSCTMIVNSESDTNVANGDNEENESIEDSFSDAPETITDELGWLLPLSTVRPIVLSVERLLPLQ